MTDTDLVISAYTLSPVKKNIWFKFENDSFSETEFKYVVELYTVDNLSTTTDYLGQYKFPPRPISGFGLFDPSTLLLSRIGYSLNPTFSSINPCFATESSSLIAYSLNYGFEYNPGLTFSDTIISGTSVGFTFSTPHGLVVDDVVNINKDNKNINSYYDGEARVIGYSTYSITIDKAVGVTSSVETGEINSVRRINLQSNDFWGYRGTRQYDERTLDFTTQYLIGESLSGYNFLTSITFSKDIGEYDWETAQFFVKGATVSNMTGMRVKTYDISNTLNNTYSFTFSATYSGNVAYLCPSGTRNLSNMGVTFSNVYSYQIELFGNPGGATNSKAIQYRSINRNCTRFQNVRIAYMNRFGAFDYFNFKLGSKETLSINRSEYRKHLDWEYSIGDRELTQLSTNVENVMNLYSDWISETHHSVLDEMVASEEVYIISDSGLKYPVNVVDSSFEYKTSLRNGLISLNMTIKTSYKIDF